MAEGTKIEWATHTWSPWTGRTKVSAACDHCYAEAWAKRSGHPELWQGARRRTSATYWQKPIRWEREAVLSGERPRIFPSLCDPFDNQVEQRWRDDFWHRIEQTPHLDWLLLTKRPQNIVKMLPDPRTGTKLWGEGWPNVWLGATAENQEEADRRIPHLLDTPAAVRFISAEPLLGPVDVGRYLHDSDCRLFYDEAICTCSEPREVKLDWVITGGESGPDARPMHPGWARSLRDQCQAARVAFHFKQWGEWLPGENLGWPLARWQDGNEGRHPSPDRIEWRHFGTPGEWGAFTIRVGKHAAGRLLDGREWSEFPANPTRTEPP